MERAIQRQSERKIARLRGKMVRDGECEIENERDR